MKKEKEVKEEKEIKEQHKDYSIEEKDQKRLKGFSKTIYIIARIMKVLAIIGIGALVLAMIFVPIFTSNIKTIKGEEESILRVFDNDIYYKRTEHTFEIYDKEDMDNKTEVTDQSDVDAINKVFDYLEKNDLTKATVFLEVELALFIAALVISVLICNKVYAFFKNIHEKSSPFIKDNIDLLEKIGKLLIISFIVTLVASIISAFMIDTSVSLNLTIVIEILVVYCALYIFKYAYKLQNDTKGKIYSE